MAESYAKEITVVSVEDELKQSYMDYAMSVIVGRALPDARDGMKPVHRRVLYAMQQLGNDYNKAYKKSARVVGDVIGKYHPHGDTAVYDTIVRMAQPFSLRYLLVDGQGNFGSVDGDAPAAMRYTEIRLTKLAHELMADLDKETVDFVPNYDETEFIPAVLPAKFPNLLVNGSSGIAVGMATNIPPHNLKETIDACIALIDQPDLTFDTLLQLLPGPDFPTAGIINGRAGIIEAYKTGRGRIHLRARANIEGDENAKQTIIVSELPYQVNKARLLEKIAELVREKKIEGITAIRDESDKDGMRMVIEVRRGENAEVILNNLYAQTQLQVVFGINMVALDELGQPRIMNLRDLLNAFLQHRKSVVTRRTLFELRKNRERAHILEGLSIALANIDPIINLIKKAPTPADAKEALMRENWQPGMVESLLKNSEESLFEPNEKYGLINENYHLSPEQAQAILDLRLQRLTALEQDKITQEYYEILDAIRNCVAILHHPEKLLAVIRQELQAISEEFSDKRRTEILETQEDFTHEDLIADEQVMVTISHQGYAKTQPVSDYTAQRRGGKGRSATATKEEDFIKHLIVAKAHDTLLCFTSRGRVYWLKTYLIPQASRQSRGKPLVNLLPLETNETISTILPLREFSQNEFVVLVTRLGTIKKMPLEHLSRPRASGIIAINLNENDDLISAAITDGKQDIMLFSDTGKAIRFHEDELRAMGRNASGVRGIRLKNDQAVIAMIVANEKQTILLASERGYGKRSEVSEFRLTGRGGQGVIAIATTERNGRLIAAVQVTDENEMMLISDKGTLVRSRVAEVSVMGRAAQGVRLINLAADEKLVGVETVIELENSEEF